MDLILLVMCFRVKKVKVIKLNLVKVYIKRLMKVK